MLIGGKREREGKGENPFTLLSCMGAPVLVGGRVRERKKKGGKLPFW
jgi:hypothetical protein